MGLILGALTKKTRNMKSVFMCPWRRKDVMRSHTKIYKELCNLVERIKKSEWKRSDIDFEEDVQSLKNLKMQEKNILLMTARFFLTVNSMVMDSFNNSLLKDLEELSSKNELLIKAIEFYNEQNRQEQVHDEFYKDIGKGNIRETVAGNYCVCNEEAMHVLGHSHIYKHVGGITKLRAREMCDELVCLVKDMWSSSFANSRPETESQFRYMNYLTSYTRANFFEAMVIEYDTIRDLSYTKGFFNNCIELKKKT
ncbi:hypothetical protein C2G38_2213195 [Gigaspora rosea]|uniref:Uncharacterized protein n=1 Tax=Gigaspora rosea TaxID=44941 RepID=A0A397UC01_9GLOM|nr:hypothetical protein C2G38_2213195 [Gigaspora rosea]